jgi:hypothetical protein
MFIVTTPEGDEMTVSNLKAFCRQHSLSDGSMIAVAQGKRRHYKGFSVKYG